MNGYVWFGSFLFGPLWPKVSTLGGFFIGQLVDVTLNALQIVRPGDGSFYIIPYYGDVVEIVRSDKKLIVFLRTTIDLLFLIG
ncbi:hypothetical protein GQX74_015657 [Glossina fuscipes]|nr:hypothetical protein GQX74_015657 [Glossina fuscipes]